MKVCERLAVARAGAAALAAPAPAIDYQLPSAVEAQVGGRGLPAAAVPLEVKGDSLTLA
jgi:hypothetical protein